MVGAGPAGLEAARVAAERGHDVTLLEASDQLGGQFRLAGRQPSRDQITDLLAWYERRLSSLGVTIRRGTPATAAEIAAVGADDIVLATGARPPRTGFQRALPLVDRLPGAERENVLAIHDVLDGATVPGRRVLLLDDLGDWRGLGTALHLAETGHDVTVLTAAAVVAGGLAHSAADVPLRRRFAAAGGAARTGVVVIDWDGSAATIRSTLTAATERLAADTLVIAETPVATRILADELETLAVPFHAIGDCVAPRRASLAIHDGRELALRL